MISKALTSFTGGELSPLLDGRVDLEKYQSGCKVVENFLIMPYGGVRRRPGLQYIAGLRDESEAGRLVPFRFSTSDTYMLCFNDSYVRIYNGGTTPAEVATELATPYAAADLAELQYVQQNDVMYLMHPDYSVRKISRTSATTFTIAAVAWDWAPMRDQNTDEAVTVACSATTGSGLTLTGVGTAWAAAMVGARIRIQHERLDTDWERTLTGDGTSSDLLVQGNWECSTFAGAGVGGGLLKIERWNGTAYVSIREFTSTGASVTVTGFEEEIVRMRIVVSGSAGAFTTYFKCDSDPYGEVEVTARASTTSLTVTVKKTLFSTDATDLWSDGAFSGVYGYPRCGVFHEGRLVFGGTASDAQTIWGSVSDDYENFNTGTEDDDSYRHSLAANEHNGIRWMVSERRLLLGTSGGEFVVGSADDSVVVTPTNVRARLHSNFGSAAIQPIFGGDSVIYAQRQARKIRQYGYVFERDRYQAADLTILSEHVTGSGITQMAYQQQRDGVVWAVNNEGELIGMVHEADQSVSGWFRCTTTGTFESVATIYGEGEEDEVWAIVKRSIDGATVRYIERLEPTQFQTVQEEDKANYFYVDCGKKITGAGLTSITLAHLEGEEVAIIADGIEMPRATVTGGVAALPSGTTASTIIAGCPMTSRLETMKIDVALATGTGRTREGRINRLGIVTWKSLGGQFGETAQGVIAGLDLDPILYRTTTDDYDTGPGVKTGEYELDMDSDYREGVTVGIVTDSVYPLAILMLVAKLDYFGD